VYATRKKAAAIVDQLTISLTQEVGDRRMNLMTISITTMTATHTNSMEPTIPRVLRTLENISLDEFSLVASIKFSSDIVHPPLRDLPIFHPSSAVLDDHVRRYPQTNIA
jgi:hypothetical protein